jgi:hypothetical protein
MVGYSDGVESDDLMSAPALEKGKGDVRLKRGMTVDDGPRREKHGRKPSDCSFHLADVYHELFIAFIVKGTYGSSRTVTFSGETPNRS